MRKRRKNPIKITSASVGADDVSRCAVGTVPSRDSLLAVALAREFVTLVADAAVDVTVTRLTGDSLRRLSVVAVIAALAPLAAVAALTRTRPLLLLLRHDDAARFSEITLLSRA